MWRVFLRLFLEVQFVTGGKDPEWWVFILEQYVKNPTWSQFALRQTSDAGNVDVDDDEHYRRDPFTELSAEDIVQEGLRLYPAMRWLYRAYYWDPLRDEGHSTDNSNANLSTSNGSRSEIRDMNEALRSPHCRILAANVENCLLNVDSWGKQAHRFDPARWCKLTRDQRNDFYGNGLMTFGTRPNMCPAEEEYGARMIGVLVGGFTGWSAGKGRLVEDDLET